MLRHEESGRGFLIPCDVPEQRIVNSNSLAYHGMLGCKRHSRTVCDSLSRIVAGEGKGEGPNGPWNVRGFFS